MSCEHSEQLSDQLEGRRHGLGVCVLIFDLHFGFDLNNSPDTLMIFRLSQKLAKKLKVGALPSLPPDQNPYADWSANLFTADRTQYIILTNTQSLYSRDCRPLEARREQGSDDWRQYL